MKLNKFKLKHLTLLTLKDIANIEDNYEKLTDEQKQEYITLVNNSYDKAMGKKDNSNGKRDLSISALDVCGVGYLASALVGFVSAYYQNTAGIITGLLMFLTVGVCGLVANNKYEETEIEPMINIPRQPIKKIMSKQNDKNIFKAKYLQLIDECSEK